MARNRIDRPDSVDESKEREPNGNHRPKVEQDEIHFEGGFRVHGQTVVKVLAILSTALLIILSVLKFVLGAI